jgi:hypothetical protein
MGNFDVSEEFWGLSNKVVLTIYWILNPARLPIPPLEQVLLAVQMY